MNLFRKIGRSFFFQHRLSRFQWYRRWYGGRWEYWFIDICYKSMWLPMRKDLPLDYRQPCSVGECIREIYDGSGNE